MRKAFAAALAASMLLAAACGDDDATDDSAAPTTESTSADGGDDGAAEPDGEVTLSDVGRLVPAECDGASNAASEDDGVTEDTVNIANLTIDFSKLAEIGFAASDRDPVETMQVFVDEVNENGGVCDRTIDVQPVRFNILAAEGGQACVEATEDRNNLLVTVASYSEVLCLTDAGVPVMSSNDLTEQEMEDSGGILFTRFPKLEEQYRATVEHADRTGALDGKVGVWYGGVYPAQTEAVEDVVLPMLDDMGVDYSAFRNDSAGPHTPEGNTALTSAATEFAAQDIDTLLAFVQNTNHTGMQNELNAQGVTPRYISMPIAGNTANELFADRFGTREVADGQEWVTFTYGMTEIDSSEPIAESCHDIWTQRTGEEVEENVYDYAAIVSTCVLVDQIVAALSLAGGELTRETYVQAVEQLPAHRPLPVIGEVDWSEDNHFGPGVFSVHSYDGSSNTVSTAEETFEIEG